MTTALLQGSLVIGLLLMVIGTMGLTVPAEFVAMVSSLQVPPKLYVAAVAYCAFPRSARG